MIRRPPRSTQSRSSAASDVYKRQLERALEIDLGALLQILLGNFRKILVEDDDAVPFGLFAPLATRFVAPALARRHAQIGDGTAVLGMADFGAGTEIADQNDLVDRSGHVMKPPRGAVRFSAPLY